MYKQKTDTALSMMVCKSAYAKRSDKLLYGVLFQVGVLFMLRSLRNKNNNHLKRGKTGGVSFTGAFLCSSLSPPFLKEEAVHHDIGAWRVHSAGGKTTKGCGDGEGEEEGS
jgi:hypothetical protein